MTGSWLCRAVGLLVLAGGMFLLIGSLCGSVAAEPEDEHSASPAATLLATAESLASQAKYKAAVACYRKLAKQYPETEEGRIGARRSKETAYLGWATILRHGEPANRIDVVVMGDGYRLKEQKKFDKTAAQVPTMFKRHHVLGAYFRCHNFHRINLVSTDSHADACGREFDTALDGKAGEGLQGQVTIDRDLAVSFLEHVPIQDGLAIAFVQRGTLGTGGSGIATVGGQSPDTVYHEWGHAFGGLGDEYVMTTGMRDEFRDAPNVSMTEDPDLAPWKHWIDARARGVGMYEGANGQVRGAWKPTNNCVMASGTDFCVVCREAVVLEIYRRVDPIDACTPEPHSLGSDEALSVATGAHFEVQVLEPTTHCLQATWWVLPEGEVPEAPTPLEASLREGDRRARGPLQAIAAKPELRARKPKRGVHGFDLDPEGLAPGRYRVICRVTDPVKGRGDKRPWVLKDTHGLLHSERAWWLQID